MRGVTIIFPLLNENPLVVEHALSAAFSAIKSLAMPGEIIIADGGSKLKLVERINTFGKSRQTSRVKFKYILDYPLIYPNKNIGIKNGYHCSAYDVIVIADSDNTNLTTAKLRKLVLPILEDKCVFVIPDLRRSGGRSNRLLGNPPIRFFFPEIYKKIPYPYPGLLAIKKTLLGKIIAKDYCFDWGGEAQIAVNGYLLSNGNVRSFYINKIDSKKRPLKSMIKDAFQLYRTNLFLAIQNKKFPSFATSVDTMVRADIASHKKEAALLVNYILNEKKITDFIQKDIYETYKEIVSLCSRNPTALYSKLCSDSGRYCLYELKVIASLVVRPLLFILFSKEINEPLVEIKMESIHKLDMRKMSFLADIIIAAMLRAYLQKKPKCLPFSNFSGMAARIPKGYTEFNNLSNNFRIKPKMGTGIDLEDISRESLSKLIKATKKADVWQRNKAMAQIVASELVGNIGGKQFTFQNLKFREDGIKISRDMPVKLSVLATIAGYLKKNNICVNASPFKKQIMERFLSYVLNNKKFAPISYKLGISFSGEDTESIGTKHSYDCVILFSGGFDSTAALLAALDMGLNPLLLWVGFGQKNEDKEYKSIKSIAERIGYPVSIIRVGLGKFIDKGWKDWDYIIPARNFMFAAFAASFLSRSTKQECTIFLSAHEEEIKHSNTDKSNYFFNKCTQLFSEYYNKTIVLSTPFGKYSKAEIAAHWRNNWKVKYGISPYDTVTCYFGNNCGRCKVCLKRTIALLAAGWNADPDLKLNPMADKDGFLANDMLLRMSTFSRKRKMELLTAIRKSWDVVPWHVRKSYEKAGKKLVNSSVSYEDKLKKFTMGVENAR